MGVIAAAGFQKVDLLGADPHFPPDADPQAIQEIERAAREAGVRIANLGTYYGRPLPGTAEETAAEGTAAVRAMDAAVRLGARLEQSHLPHPCGRGRCG